MRKTDLRKLASRSHTVLETSQIKLSREACEYKSTNAYILLKNVIFRILEVTLKIHRSVEYQSLLKIEAIIYYYTQFYWV